MLISCGLDGTKFWDLNDYNNINSIKYFKKHFVDEIMNYVD